MSRAPRHKAPVKLTGSPGDITTVTNTATLNVVDAVLSANERIEQLDGINDIGFMNWSGSASTWNVNVATAGTYVMNVPLATPLDGVVAQIYANGQLVASAPVAKGYGWDAFQNTAFNVPLNAGMNTITFGNQNGQYNIRNATLSLPTSSSTSGTVKAAQYTNLYAGWLETQNGVQDVGYVTPNVTYIDYQVTVSTTGAYSIDALTAAVGGNAKINLLVNGKQQQTITAPLTGDWAKYADVTTTLNLTAGVNTIRFASAGDGFNLRQFTYSVATPPAPATPGAQIGMRYGTDLVVTDQMSNDTINVTESGGQLIITTNGVASSWSLPPAGVFIYTNGEADKINIDSSVNINCTIVSIDGVNSTITDNDPNSQIWIDGNDTLTTGVGNVHHISSYAGGTTKNKGDHLADPSDIGSTVAVNTSLWGTGPQPNDVRQGQLSDCYFLAPLQDLAQQKPGNLEGTAVDLGDGTYAVEFIRNGVTSFVRVDNLVATSYASPYEPRGWGAVMEKAYAYFRTGADTYSSLNWGSPSAALSDLGFSNTYTYAPYVADASLAAQLSSALAAGKAVAFTSMRSIPSGIPIIASHCYRLVSVNSDGTFTVRNPWGYDAFNDDSNPGDGLVTLTSAQLKASIPWISVTNA